MIQQLENLLSVNVGTTVVNLLIRIVFVIVIFVIGVQVIKLVRAIIRKSMEKAKAEKGVMQFVDSFVKSGLYVVLIFMIASNLGMEAASIVALLGSAGVAIGLAVQGSLSNLAGGVLILLLKPFKVGDYIIENSSKQEGTVTEIQIFYTKLTTADNKTVILPNGNLANNSLINVTANGCRRLDIFLQVSYDSDLLKTKEVLQEVLEQETACCKNKEKIVYVDELQESGVSIGVRCFVMCEEYFALKWRLTENCKAALDKAGIVIPYPHMNVKIDSQTR